MDAAVVASIISGGVAAFAAVLSLTGQSRMQRMEADLALQKAAAEQRAETERLARKYSEPLGRAAYDLQSRIFNMAAMPDPEYPQRGRFLDLYLRGGDARTRNYAVKNTLFLIAQYFAWTELVRREIQFIDLGADKETRRLATLQDSIYSLWQTDEYDPLLRIFAGEQRAIGERLIREGLRGPECMGYASFLDFYQSNPDPLLLTLEAEIMACGTSLEQARPRLVALQHALVELLAFIDPQFVRFPERTRMMLGASSGTAARSANA